MQPASFQSSPVRVATLLLAAALLLLAAPRALAWGDRGHELVCEIAFQEMGEAARREVQRLIRLDPEYSTFARACTWADDSPQKQERGTEHYLNVPRDTPRIASADCGAQPKCVLSAIAAERHELSRPGIRDDDKLRRLKFLGHWIGDLHQPLHVSFADDRGGNQIHELGDACPGEWRLHGVWDVCLVEERVLEGSLRQTARRLLAGVSDAERRRWRGGHPVAWADESYRLARRPDVEYCVERRRHGRPLCAYAPDNPVLDRGEAERELLIDERYLDLHAPAARQRILRAGIRLAALLDELLGAAGGARGR